MTEEQARENWCPFAHVMLTTSAFGGGVAANRYGNDMIPLKTRCIASRCMGWRWFVKDKDGYCGLVGVSR
jgi:hypothetical protein